jgi:hypothetical protein
MARMNVSIVGGKVEIAESGKRGGNVRAATGQRIVWIKDTASVTTFDLKVERLAEGPGALDSTKDWPFVSVKATGTAAKVNEVDCEVTFADAVAVRIADDPGIFKYTITATPNPPGPSVTLDPVIIIDKK